MPDLKIAISGEFPAVWLAVMTEPNRSAPSKSSRKRWLLRRDWITSKSLTKKRHHETSDRPVNRKKTVFSILPDALTVLLIRVQRFSSIKTSSHHCLL